MRRRTWLAVAAALALILAVTQPAGADPELGDHPGPGSTGPDAHTKNVKLKANVVKSAPNVTQSDLAFDGKLAYAGNYNGFRVIDISDPDNPVVVTNFECRGLQGDVSVYRGLLFRSVDQPLASADCGAPNATAATPGAWEGIQVFDVSNPAAPSVVDFIPTDCGSHTHTLYPQGDTVFIYVSSYPLTPVNIGAATNCLDVESGGGHGYVSVIELDVNDPTDWTVHQAFLDPSTEVVTYDLDTALGLPAGTLGTHSFTACHDISVFAELQVAAAACFRDAQLWDISDPVNPSLLWTFKSEAIQPSKVDLWHSAAFSWDGEVVAFGDESGGGIFNRCTDPSDDQGRVWFLGIEDGSLLANYKTPRVNPAGACTMHNFNFIPQSKGRRTLVSASYTAGTTIVDVNKLIAGASEADAEVGFYTPDGANTWSSYWYNGFIYTNDINRGVDVMLLSDKARAGQKKLATMNPQTQINVIE